MSKSLVIIVEDEEKIASLLVDYLQLDGFETLVLNEGTHAVDTIRESQPDFVILDVMLPGQDGLSICKAVRQFSNVPVMMLTARVDEIDRLLGLEFGADDYVCKPFLPREVVARVKAILRRGQMNTLPVESTEPVAEKSLLFKGVTVYPTRYRCEVKGEVVDLTPIEFRLLHTMMGRIGRVFSREALIDQCYNDDRVISDRTIDSHLKNLRRKLHAVIDEEIIHSVYGVGYKVE